jgi:hypothetical protein
MMSLNHFSEPKQKVFTILHPKHARTMCVGQAALNQQPSRREGTTGLLTLSLSLSLSTLQSLFGKGQGCPGQKETHLIGGHHCLRWHTISERHGAFQIPSFLKT